MGPENNQCSVSSCDRSLKLHQIVERLEEGTHSNAEIDQEGGYQGGANAMGHRTRWFALLYPLSTFILLVKFAHHPNNLRQ